MIESQAKWTGFCRGILSICKSLLQNYNVPVKADEALKDATEKVAKYEKILSANEEDLKDIEQKYSPRDPSVPLPEAYPRFSSHNSTDPAANPELQDLSQSLSMISQMQPQQPLAFVKFGKVKEFLASAKDDIKTCAVLQALRWRMTRAKHGEQRSEIIKAYVENDLLGVLNKDSTLLKGLITHPNRKVVEYAVCYLNVLASESSGAGYLVKSEELVRNLLTMMKSEKGDTNLRQNTLGALQKFSLHRTPQTIMINGGCIEWIAEVIKNESETLGDYTFEYITALLMNLALRTAGKNVCENPDLGILKALLDHIEHENLQVRTYINGTLYSLLTRPAIKEQAKAYGMEEMLQHMFSNADEQISRQLVYILNQLKADQLEECVSDDNEDALDFEDEENYETENEEEVDEDIVNSGLPVGEMLLQEFAEGDAIPPSAYPSPTKSLNKSTISTTSRNLPSAMKSRPKIPRTPISQEMLNIMKKENESILKSPHIYKSETTHKKKAVDPAEAAGEKPVPAPVEESKKDPQERPLPPPPAAEEKKDVEVVKEAAPTIVEPDKKEEHKQGDPMTKTQEFKFAFKSRLKIVRTPPKKDKPASVPEAKAPVAPNVNVLKGKEKNPHKPAATGAKGTVGAVNAKKKR